jgi:hypothetical protein
VFQHKRVLSKITCIGGDNWRHSSLTAAKEWTFIGRFSFSIAPFISLFRLEELGQIRIFDSRTLKEMRGLAQEVQTEINTALLNPLESVEMNDWTHFGKVRCALEKRLRGSEPRAGFEEK